MKQLLKLEEAAQLCLCLFLLYDLQSPWWCYALLVIGPDIGMLGYLGGNKSGAFTYNLLHHKGLAVAFVLTGCILPDMGLLLTGIILLGHSSMDRMFGYGLKTSEGFAFTHLGKIGKK